MFYTADPVRDALRYDEMMEKASESREASEVMYAEMITEAFTVDLPKVSNVKLLSVPYVSSADKVVYQPITEAVSDMIQDDRVFTALMQVLRSSPCAEVANLRALMAKEYADKWVSELGEYAQ